MSCFVLSCKSHSSRKNNNETFVSFHRMPSMDKENWFKVIPRARNNWTKHSRICSKHFTQDCFVISDKWRRLKPGATPSLLLDSDGENTPPSPGRPPLQPLQINYNVPSINAEIFDQNQGPSNAMEIDDIPISTSACLLNKIKKLEEDLEKAKRLCRKRLLKINTLRKKTKRLKNKNNDLEDKLEAILSEENLQQDKHLMLEAVAVELEVKSLKTICQKNKVMPTEFMT